MFELNAFQHTNKEVVQLAFETTVRYAPYFKSHSKNLEPLIQIFLSPLYLLNTVKDSL